jgi:ssDNA-specific exonuclease RecJ
LFDEQFNFVTSNSGVMQVQPGTEKQPLIAPEQLVSKNGYLFVYVSNESPQDVYFDDFGSRASPTNISPARW